MAGLIMHGGVWNGLHVDTSTVLFLGKEKKGRKENLTLQLFQILCYRSN